MLSKATIYGVLHRYVMGLEGTDIDKVIDKWKPTPPEGAAPGIPSLINLAAHLRDDIRSESNKSAGKADVERAMRDVLRVAKTLPNASLHTAFMCDGMQVACDGYRAIRLKEKIALPTSQDFTLPNLGDMFARAAAECDKEIELPSVAELKAHIATKQAERTTRKKIAVLWSFGTDKPWVNAEYLLAIMTAFPDAKVKWSKVYNPILFTDDMGDAILLPVRRKENEG